MSQYVFLGPVRLPIFVVSQRACRSWFGAYRLSTFENMDHTVNQYNRVFLGDPGIRLNTTVGGIKFSTPYLLPRLTAST